MEVLHTLVETAFPNNFDPGIPTFSDLSQEPQYARTAGFAFAQGLVLGDDGADLPGFSGLRPSSLDLSPPKMIYCFYRYPPSFWNGGFRRRWGKLHILHFRVEDPLLRGAHRRPFLTFSLPEVSYAAASFRPFPAP